jgi:asparagine synthase (glutamine-hydrolysing)
MDKYLKAINQQLEKEYKIYSKSLLKPAVLVSGGLDSSIIAVLTNKYFLDCELFSFGTLNNSDKPFTEILGKHLNKNISWLNISLLDLEKNLETVKKLLVKVKVDTDLTNLSLGLGYFLIFKKIKKEKIKYVFTGQGPDILFAGYHRYRRLSANQLINAISEDLKLLEIDKRRDSAVAEYFKIKLINPFLEPDFVKLALTIPADYKIKDKIEKYIVRHYAKLIGLPTELATRPKKAFQYSTGIQSLLLKQKKIY